MERNILKDLYQNYKLGTRYAIQWLVDTASGLSDPSTKGSQRKPAKDLTTRDLNGLAETIADAVKANKPAPKGIDTTIVVLESTIATRREYSEWLRWMPQQTQRQLELNTGTQQEREAHEHFVHTLQSILGNIKQARQRSKGMAENGRSGRKKAKKPFKYLFRPSNPPDHTFCEESDDECPAPAQIPVPSKPLAKSTKKKASAPKTEALSYNRSQEKYRRLWSFLNEAQRLRLSLKETWLDYRKGKSSIEIAAAVTDSAFQLIREDAEAVRFEFPELQTFDAVAKILEIRAHKSGDEFRGLKLMTSNTQTDKENDAADCLCVPALTTLLLLRDISANLPKDVDRAIDALRHIDTAHRSGAIVFDMASELRLLAASKQNLKSFGGGDTFTHFLTTFMVDHCLTLHLVPCFQIYMDILDVVDGIEWHQYAQLRQIKMLAESSTGLYERTVPQLHDYDLFKRDHCDRPIRAAYMSCMDAVLPEISSEDRMEECYDSEPIPGALMFLNQLPVLCGRFATFLVDLKHGDGVNACNRGRIIVATAHLYKAAVNAGLLKAKWDDVEFVIAHHGQKTLGFREAHKDTPILLHAARQYGLALGVSLDRFARTQVQGSNVAEQRADPPTYASILSRKCSELDSMSLHVRAVTESMQSAEGVQSGQTYWTNDVLHRLARKVLASNPLEYGTEICSEWHNKKELNNLQLLEVLKTTLVNEELNTHFDYHALFTLSARILGVADSARSNKMYEPRSSKPFGEGYYMYELVNEILWEAAELENESPEAVKEKSTLGKFAVFLEDWLQEASDMSIQAARIAAGHNCSKWEVQDDPEPEVKTVETASKEPPKLELKGNKLEFIPVDYVDKYEMLKEDLKAERKRNRGRKNRRKFRMALEWQPAQQLDEIDEEVYYSAAEEWGHDEAVTCGRHE